MINTRQNQQNDLCAQRRLRSDWASASSDQSLLCRLKLFLIFWNSLTFEEEKKIYLPIDRPLSRVRGNKNIFKGSRDIAKLKAV